MPSVWGVKMEIPVHTISEESNIPNMLASTYLNLMKKCLTRTLFVEHFEPVPTRFRKGRVHRILSWGPMKKVIESRGLAIVRTFDLKDREVGKDWPGSAETMIGLRRLDNIQQCVERILAEKIPGDLIETGVWRGGAAIFMRAVLLAYGDLERRVWLADSFQGLPQPDPLRYPQDRDDRLFTYTELAVSQAAVRRNFERYGLLDAGVCFLEGWFRDTLPNAPIEQLSLLRLDGDMYESTIDALTSLYQKVSQGGYIIVDDYGSVEGCMQAVTDFRKEHNITDPIHSIDGSGVYWKKGGTRTEEI